MKVQTMIVLLFERMLALESTCVVKRFRVHRMCAPGSFIFYFFVACTRRHLGHIIAPLIVATLAHIAVVTAHIVSITAHIAAATSHVEAITSLAAATIDYV